jgi:hypothetical protein
MLQKGKGEELATFSLVAVLAATLSIEALPKAASDDLEVTQAPLSVRVQNILERTGLGEAALSRLEIKGPFLAQWRN